MTIKTTSSLLLLLTTLYTSVLMAERPAVYDEAATASEEPANTETMADEGRPAVDEPTSVEVIEQTGDVMTMPAEATSDDKVISVQTLDFPRRGMTQDKVQNELGRPVEIIPPLVNHPLLAGFMMTGSSISNTAPLFT